jgi:hypothetical protein
VGLKLPEVSAAWHNFGRTALLERSRETISRAFEHRDARSHEAGDRER